MRGGKRLNAGVKPRDGVARVAINCRVSAETKAWLDANSTDGMGVLIDRLVRSQM